MSYSSFYDTEFTHNNTHVLLEKCCGIQMFLSLLLLDIWQFKCILLSLVCVLLQTLIHASFFFLAGVGRTAPDPSASVTLDGVQVPLGKGSHTNIDDTSLLYNEYPLTVTTWFMNLIMILPKDVTFFLLCYIIDYLIVRRKVQSQTSYISFLTLN